MSATRPPRPLWEMQEQEAGHMDSEGRVIDGTHVVVTDGEAAAYDNEGKPYPEAT